MSGRGDLDDMLLDGTAICADCVFHGLASDRYSYTAKGKSLAGLCRRNPPRVDEPDQWPVVNLETDWCGEFRQVREGDETDVQIETPSIQVGTGDRLFTGEELADYLNVSRAQVYNFLRRGLPSLKLGKSRRYRLSDVTTWLDQFNETAST